MKKAQTKIIITVGVLILIIIIAGLLLAVVQVPYTANVVYTDKEPTTNKECKYEDYNYRLTEGPVQWKGSSNSGFYYEQEIYLEPILIG